MLESLARCNARWLESCRSNLRGITFFSQRPLRRLLVAAVWLVFPLGQAVAQLPSAQLHTIFPPGAKQGSTIDVAIGGTDLDGAKELRFSHPGITAVAKMAPPSEFDKTPRLIANQFTLKIAADVPTGVYDVRAVGLYGITNPRRFVISNATEINKTQAATTPETAIELAVGSVINANSPSNNANFYKFTAKAGERLLIDVMAYRIDSRMDATLTLLDASGNEIASSRDANRRDPLIDFTAPADGQYVVKVYDFLFRGGNGQYFYRLSVHSRPHVDFIFPPAGLPGSKGQYFLFGRNLPGGTVEKDVMIDGRPLEKLSVEITIPGDADSRSGLAVSGLVEPAESGTDRFDYTLKTPQGHSNPVSLGFATAAVVLEQEPANNDANKPQQVTLPCEIAGQFYPRGDEDWYTFEAKKGDVYWIEVLSQQLGLPTDPYVLLQRVSTDDKGVQKATFLREIDDHAANRGGNKYLTYQTNTDDPVTRFEVPEDGTYRILIRDLYNRSRGNPRFVYRLSIRSEQPDFRLVAVAEGPTPTGGQIRLWNPLLRKGGTVPIRVVAFRRDGFDGPIDVSIEGLPAGVTAPKVIIGSGQTTARLVLIADDGAADWAGTIGIVGKAKIGEAEMVRKARSGSVVWGAANNKSPSRSRLSREIALAVMSAESVPAAIHVGEGKVWEMTRGGKLQIPIKVKRSGGFKGNLPLQAINLPANLKAGNVAINGTATDGKLTVDIATSVKPGTYTFCMQAPTETNYSRNPQAVETANKEKEEITKIAAAMAEASKQAAVAKVAADKVSTAAAGKAKQASDGLGAIEKLVQQIQTKVKSAADALTAAKTAAEKSSEDQNLANALKQAQQQVEQTAAKLKTETDKRAAAKTANDTAQAEAQKMAAAQKAAEAMAKQAAEVAKRAGDAKKVAEKRATDRANQAKPKKTKLMLISTNVTIKVTDSPIVMVPVTAPGPLSQGQKIEIPVTINRLYDCKEPIEVTVKLPGGVKGVKIAKLTIAAGQVQGKLTVEAAADATPGDHLISLTAIVQYNKQKLQAVGNVTLKIVAAAK